MAVPVTTILGPARARAGVLRALVALGFAIHAATARPDLCAAAPRTSPCGS